MGDYYVVLPYGCYATTDRPHVSYYTGGPLAQVYGHTVCPYQMNIQETYTVIEKDRLNGWWYETIGASEGWTYIKKDKSGYISAWAVANGPCDGNRIYRGRSFHYFVGPDGNSYTTRTSQGYRFTC